jgi:hypothetical protein
MVCSGHIYRIEPPVPAGHDAGLVNARNPVTALLFASLIQSLSGHMFTVQISVIYHM